MPLIKAVVNGVTGLLRRNGALAGAVKCCCGWVCAYVDDVPGGDKECYPKGQQPYPTSEDTEYKNETECRKYCDQEYVCAWKSFDPADGKECVKKGTEASPLLIISTYLTTDCDGMCVDEYYCAWKDDTPSKCYPDAPPADFDSSGPYATAPDCEDNCKKKYNCRTSDYDCIEDPDGPYDSMKECEEYCKDTQYYCCEDSDGIKTCRQGGCEYYGENQVGGPYIDDIECADDCKTTYYCCEDSTGVRSCYTGQCPAGFTTVAVYYDETECNEKCPVYYVCAQKTAYPVDGYECVQWNAAIDPSVILNQYETPDCDGECPPDPVYFCCEDATGDKDCYQYGCPPDRTEVGGPYSTPRECSIDCGVKYYCCEDSDGNKTCRDDECEYYGENAVSGPYDTKDLCDPECGKYWYCVSTDKCASGDSGPYDNETACLDGAPVDCKVAYTCEDNGDGTTSCVEDPNGEYDTDDCGGNCNRNYDCLVQPDGSTACVPNRGGAYTEDTCGGDCDKPKQKYACNNNDCIPIATGPYDEPTCGGNCEPKYSCVNGDCVRDPNGVYTEDTCGGLCGGATIGGCCTEYGLSNVSRDQCKAWGGTFHEPGEVFDTTCGCDCTDIGGQVSILLECAELSDWTTCGIEGQYCSKYNTEQNSYFGGYPQFPQNDPAGLLDGIRAKGAQIIFWIDAVRSLAQKPGDQQFTECCLVGAGRNVQKFRTFALNCREKKWEEVANIAAQYDSEIVSGTGSTDGVNGVTCNGQLILASEDPVAPPVTIVASAPTCIRSAPNNPLP